MRKILCDCLSLRANHRWKKLGEERDGENTKACRGQPGPGCVLLPFGGHSIKKRERKIDAEKMFFVEK